MCNIRVISIETRRNFCDSSIHFVRMLFKPIGIALFFGVLGVQTVRSESPPGMIEKTERAVIKIEVETEKREALGSGFVVDEKGVAITNAHVIKNAKNANAIFPDGRTVAVSGVYVFDQSRDLAVIQLKQSEYESIPIAKGLPAKGTTLLAFGSPAGLSFTVTRGIVSAIRTAKEMQIEMGIEGAKGTWIQCDVPLSPGNSGGPLVDENGNVVAVSTLASTGRAQNINFGISAVDVQNAILESQKKPLQKLSLGTLVSEGIPMGPLFGSLLPKFDPFKPKQLDYKSIIASIPDDVVKEYVMYVKSNVAKFRPEISQSIVSYKQELKRAQAKNVKKKPTESDKSKMGKGGGALSAMPSNTYDSLEEKKRAVEFIETKIEKLQATLAKGAEDTQEGLLNIVANCSGRTVNPSMKYTVGKLFGADVVSAIDDNQLAIKFTPAPNQLRDGMLFTDSTFRYTSLRGKQITLEPEKNPLDDLQKRMEKNMGVNRVPIPSPRIDHLFAMPLNPMLVFVVDDTQIKISSSIRTVSVPTFCQIPLSQLNHIVGRVTAGSTTTPDEKSVSKSSSTSVSKTKSDDEPAKKPAATKYKEQETKAASTEKEKNSPLAKSNTNDEVSFRMWNDISGSFNLKAKLISVEGDRVSLQKEDGKIIQMELGKLSLEDQKFIQEK